MIRNIPKEQAEEEGQYAKRQEQMEMEEDWLEVAQKLGQEAKAAQRRQTAPDYDESEGDYDEIANAIENMAANDPRLRLLLRKPPSQRTGPFKMEDVPESRVTGDLGKPNKYGVRISQMETRRFLDRITRPGDVMEKWRSTGWYIVRCPCGTEWEEERANIPTVKRCGCAGPAKPRYDLLGGKFARLTVTGYDMKSGMWVCKCSCDGEVMASTGRLRNGLARNCGDCAKAAKVGMGRPTTAVAEERRQSAAVLGIGGYKMFNMAAKHHAFVGYLKQQMELPGVEVVGMALQGFFPDEWAEWVDMQIDSRV